MADQAPLLSPEIRAALAAHARAGSLAIQRLEVALARLALDHAPSGSRQHLELVEQHLGGADVLAALAEARQECWSHATSLACGCSVADSASAHAMLACSETGATAHSPASLREQTERVLRCGVTAEQVLRTLSRAEA